MSWFFNAIPYVLALGSIALGAFEIIKNWHEYKKSWLKNSVAGVFFVVGVLSLVGLYHDGRERKDAELQMAGLREEVKTANAEAKAANDAQKDNTKLFTEWSKQMSDQVGDLKAEVKTEKLQQRLAEVQADLEKSMKPGPKAELAFTFFPFTNPPPPAKPVLSKQVTIPLDSDGAVHVDFTAVNPTEVDATDGSINLRICDRCKFAKEPEGFTRMKGWGESVRFSPFTNIHAMEAFRTITLDVIPPEGINRIQISFAYRCHTCVLLVGSSEATSGTVYIIRSGLRMKTTTPASTQSP